MECHVAERGRYVRVLIGPADAGAIAACYRKIAVVCAEHKIACALIVSMDGDPTDHHAVRAAIRTLAVTGVPPDFKLAMTSENRKNLRVYKLAEVTARRRQINARAFEELDAALAWLDG